MRAMLWRRLGTYLLVSAMALVPVLVAPSVAQAVPGLVYEDVISTTGTASALSATATCPRGTVVIGGGGGVYDLGTGSQPAPNELVLTELRPVAFVDLQGYHVAAREDATGYDGDWGIMAQAICAPKPPGHQVVRASAGPPSSAASKVAVVSCPHGKQVMGTGAAIHRGGPHVALNGVFPTGDDLTKVAAIANADDSGNGGNWSLDAWAVCTDPQPGLQRVLGSTSSASVQCPVGLQVHGLGAQPTGQSGQMRLNRLDHGTTTVNAELYEDEDGYSGPGTGPPVAIPIAICAN